MSIKTRLERLEKAKPISCPGCAPRPLTWHHAYALPSGEEIYVPPLPAPRPACTCRPARKPRGADYFVIQCGVVESREAAEQDYAQLAASYRPWWADDDKPQGTRSRVVDNSRSGANDL
jgi:hypothetical protein